MNFFSTLMNFFLSVFMNVSFHSWMYSWMKNVFMNVDLFMNTLNECQKFLEREPGSPDSWIAWIFWFLDRLEIRIAWSKTPQNLDRMDLVKKWIGLKTGSLGSGGFWIGFNKWIAWIWWFFVGIQKWIARSKSPENLDRMDRVKNGSQSKMDRVDLVVFCWDSKMDRPVQANLWNEQNEPICIA